MKTLIRLEDNVSLYIFDDAKQVDVGLTGVTVGNPVDFYISFCNAANSVLMANVTPPADWTASKYCFDGTDWTLNPAYIEPTPQE